MNYARTIAVVALLSSACPVFAAEKPSQLFGEAKIERDEWGIAHISGKTDADAVYGMIYAQAEDDFPRIERNYLVSMGRLAEAEGETAVWQDLRMRMFNIPANRKRSYDYADPKLRALMDAWAAGLNDYLADHPEAKPKVLTHFEPWMALTFTEGSIGGDIEHVPLSQLEAFYSKRKIAMTDLERGAAFREPQGSNGMAIAPSHTKDGHALLLINPHTSFFFRSELQMTSEEGLNAYGAVTWGQFFIYQGFNAHAGWMHTTSGADSVDDFAETVRPLTQREAARWHNNGYMVKSRYKGWSRLGTRVVTLSVRQPDGTLQPRSFTTYVSDNGPIVREEGGKWIAVKMMNMPIGALTQSFQRTKANDLAEFKRALSLGSNSSNNTLFADDKGDIAYFHPQFIPVRDDRFDYTKPVDGSDPATRWASDLPPLMAKMPNVINPANGWVFNVNNAPWTAAGADSPKAADYPRYMDQAGENARGPHAERVLGANKAFTIESLMAAAYDPWLPAFDRLLPSLAAAHAAAPDAKRDGPMQLLQSWDHRWALDSKATTLAVGYAEALWARYGDKDADEDGPVGQWIYKGASDADRLAALDTAVARLTADFGSWQVPWGQINRYQRNDGAVAQVFDDAKPSTPIPFASAQWGSLASFGVKRYPGTKRMYGTNGNSFVAVVEFGPKVRARAVSIGGESNDPANPHFADQVDRYARGDLRTVYFYPEDLAGHIVSTKVIKRRN